MVCRNRWRDCCGVRSGAFPTGMAGAFLFLMAVVGSGAVGRLVGFYSVEAAITAGLCMANMGGTGDVAVLMAAKRMELMPFAQISSRPGGAFIILFASGSGFLRALNVMR